MLAALALCVAQATAPPPVMAGVPAVGSVQAYVLGVDGDLQVAGWTVSLASFFEDPSRQGLRVYGCSRRADIDPVSGCARFNDLRPGMYEVRATHPVGDSTKSLELLVEPRKVTSFELRLAHAAPEESLYVDVHGGESSARTRLVASSGAGDPIELARDAIGARFVARGVPTGRYTVSVDDPRYRAVSVKDVVPGVKAALDLVGSASLALRFRCATDGAALIPMELVVLDSQRVVARVGPAGMAAADDVQQLAGLVPGDHVVLARFERHATLELPVDALAPSERRALEIDVAIGTTLRGVVLDANGVPCAGVQVATHVRRGVEAALGGDRRVGVLSRGAGGALVFRPAAHDFIDERSTMTDAAGRYVLQGLSIGATSVVARPNPWDEVRAMVAVPREAVELEVPELRLPGAGRCDVTLTLPAGVALSDVRLALEGDGASRAGKPSYARITLDSSGRVALRGLAERRGVLSAEVHTRGNGPIVERDPKWRVQMTASSVVTTELVLDLRER